MINIYKKYGKIHQYANIVEYTLLYNKLYTKQWQRKYNMSYTTNNNIKEQNDLNKCKNTILKNNVDKIKKIYNKISPEYKYYIGLLIIIHILTFWWFLLLCFIGIIMNIFDVYYKKK